MQPFEPALSWLQASWQAVLTWLVILLSVTNPQPTVSSTVRDNANGVDRLYSQSRAQGGHGRFECLASHSGQCHYLVVDRDCQAGACVSATPLSFSVAVGETVERDGLPEHPHICVDAQGPSECTPP